MSKKAKFITGTYVVAALVTLSLLSAISYSRLAQYRRVAAYGARSSFETTVRSVDKMGAALQKILYATDSGLRGSICGEIYAHAEAAETALAAMPFATQEMENLSAFLNRAGDYAYSLSAHTDDEGFGEEQQAQLAELAAQAEDFSALLREVQTDLNNGLVLMDSREQRLRNVGAEDGEKVSASLLNYEAGLEPGTLEYDGQYTDKEDKPAGQYSEEELRELAASAAGVEARELKEEYDYTGPDGRRCYSAGEMLICVSSRGLESIGQSRLVSGANIGLEEARRVATDFLSKLSLEDMALVSYSDSGTIASFDFAQVQDEAFRLDSGVRVSVALDDGSIYAYNGEKYEQEPAQVNWNASEDQAREKLPQNVSSENVRKVIIRSAGGRDLPCYEFTCLSDEGRALKIYVNADTGKQCRIDI